MLIPNLKPYSLEEFEKQRDIIMSNDSKDVIIKRLNLLLDYHNGTVTFMNKNGKVLNKKDSLDFI